MSLYLDSAHPADAHAAAALGLVRGVTTNPHLMAAAGGDQDDILAEILASGLRPIFYQVNAPTLDEREAEAVRLHEKFEGEVAIKIPCTTENLILTAKLVNAGIKVGVTAVFSPAQAVLTCESGADYILPYVSRTTRALGDGMALVETIRNIIDVSDVHTQIIAASLKSTEEAVHALLSGAHHLTLSLDLIHAMGKHPLSEQAIDEFSKPAPRLASRATPKTAKTKKRR